MSAPALAILDEQQKSDQIALHVYTKLFHVVYQARSGETGERGGERLGGERGDRGPGVVEGADARPAKAKTDRWFNLETPDSDLFPRELREVYKALSATFPRAPPQLYIHVLLAVPDAAPQHGSGANNVLVALAQSNTRPGGGARIRIEPTPRYVLLEKWAMTFVPNDVGGLLSSPHHLAPLAPHSAHPHSPTAAAQGDAVALATIYKHGIPLFRSLYTLLRILPVWKLYKRLRRRTTGPSSSQLSIQLHVTDRDEVAGVGGMGGANGAGGILLFGVPPSPAHPPLPTLTHTFPSIPHPLGSFTLSATYLESPTFQLDDLESLLSSKFISLDEGFVPTLTSKPRSEASPESIAERFVMRQPPLVAQQLHPPPGGSAGGHSQHKSESSVSGGSHSPSLPALSRLRLESSPGRHGRSTSLSLPPSPVAVVSPLPAPVPLLAPAPSQAQGSSSGSGSGSGSGLGLGLGLGLGPAPSISAFGMRRSSSSSSTPPPPLPLQLHTHPHTGAAMPIPFAQPHQHPTPHSPYSQSSSLGSQSHAGVGMGSQALPIRRPNTINPFKANTVLGASASGGSPAPGSGSGSGSGSVSGLVVAPGTSAGSIHSLRHASSPLGPGGGGGGGGGGDSSSLTRSPPHHTSPLMHSHSQQPFPTQYSPRSPFAPAPQGLSGSGSGSVSALGLGLVGSGSSSTGMQGYAPPSSPVPAAPQSSSSAPTIPTRKRYSSSFSHRYVSPGSVGSAPGAAGTGVGAGVGAVGASPAGSASPLGVSPAGVTRDWGGASSPGPEDVIGKPRSRSSSFLGKRTEDDDISLFMQDIETRKPLSGRWRMEVHEREESGGSGGEGEDAGGKGEEQGRHAREAAGGADGADRGPARAGGGSIASEVTMKGSGHALAPIITTMADASNVPDANNEANDGISSRRSSYAYQSYPYQPSPLSPRPRPKPQAQSISPVSRDAALGHARHQSQGSPSLPVTTASASTSTGTATPDAVGGGSGTPSISPPGAIPTSQAEVELRLKKMNETFLKSLAGFGDGWASSASVQRDGGGQGRSLSGGRRSASESGVRTGVETGSRSPGTERFESRGRDRDRVLPAGLANLSRHGSEEVIGTLELGGGGAGGREYSLERAQLAAMGMGRGRKPRA